MTSIGELIEYTASPKYRDDMLVSSDRSILSKRQVEIIPRESSTFGYQNAASDVSTDTLNDKLTFNISDPRHYLDWKNSYFQCNFKCRAVDNAGVAKQAFLDNGGIHACIKTVILRHGSAEIHRIDNYNKLYNIWNLSLNDSDYRERVLASAGDSVDDKYASVETDYHPITYSKTAGIYTDATKTLSALAGNALNQLKVGDLLEIVAHNRITAAANDVAGIGALAGHVQPVVNICRVASITDANTVVLENSILVNAGGAAAAAFAAGDAPGVVAAGDVQAGGLKSIVRIRRVQNSTRKRMVQSVAAAALVDTNLCFQIPFGLFASESYFPLPFCNQNLELVLEFVHPALSIVLDKGAGDTANKLGYSITKPRFVARMVEPSADVFEAHRKLWQEDGLVYRMLNYRGYESQLTATNQFNLSYQTNIKSLQGALAVSASQTNQSASGNAVAAQEEYCQSSFLKDAMSYYRFRIGGQSFPDYGNVDVNDQASSQAWMMLQSTMGSLGNRYQGSSIKPSEWQSTSGSKFIVSMNFAKEGSLDGSVYNNGVDITGNYLELELRYTNDLASPRTLYTFLAFDQVISLSKESGGMKVFW